MSMEKFSSGKIKPLLLVVPSQDMRAFLYGGQMTILYSNRMKNTRLGGISRFKSLSMGRGRD